MIRMLKDTKFNLGQLSITSNQEKPDSTEVSVRAKTYQNAQEAKQSSILKGVADADCMIEKMANNWRLQGLLRQLSSQKLAVQQSAGKNHSGTQGCGSWKEEWSADAGTVAFDWA